MKIVEFEVKIVEFWGENWGFWHKKEEFGEFGVKIGDFGSFGTKKLGEGGRLIRKAAKKSDLDPKIEEFWGKIRDLGGKKMGFWRRKIRSLKEESESSERARAAPIDFNGKGP